MHSSSAHRLLAWTGTLAVAAGLAVAVPGTASAATFTVSNTSDEGTGSLRDAINQANSNPGPDDIVFTVPDGTTIEVPGGTSSALPPITDPVTIDGYTANPSAASPPVRIEATGSPDSIFWFDAGSEGSSLSGLDIAAASGQVIGVGAVRISEDAIAISNNWFGLNDAGTAANDGTLQRAVLVEDDGDAAASNALISANAIGEASTGIGLDPGTNNDLVTSNTIGLTPDLTTPLPINQGILADTTQLTNIVDNRVVGTGAFSGIELWGGTDDYVAGNLVGIVGSATPSPVPNAGWGIYLHDGVTTATVTGNEVASYGDGIRADGGGTSVTGSAYNNFLHGLSGAGIRFAGATSVQAWQNSIYDTGIGIKHGYGLTPSSQDQGGGPALSEITAGSDALTIDYDGPDTLANQDATVEFYLNDSCNSIAGVGDGKNYLGSANLLLDSNGAIPTTTLNLNDYLVSPRAFAADDKVTATIVPLFGTGSTTEFSNCFTVPAGPGNQEPFTDSADPNPASVGLNQTVDITLTGTDADGDALTFGLPGGGTSINGGNAVALLGSPSCDGNIPSTCTQVARYSASTTFLGSDVFTWTVDDGTVTAPAASAQVDVIDAGLRMTNVLWFEAGYVPGSPTAMQAFAVNDGPDTALNTVMTVSAAGGGALPAGVSLVSGNGINDAVNAGSCTEAAGVITCPIGDLQSLGLAGIDLTVSTSGATPDPLVVEATISSDTPDAFSANNTYTSPGLPVAAAGTADLAVGTLVDTPDPVTAGGDVQYTTTVTNNGPDAATGIQVKLNGDSSGSLPADTSFVSGTAGTATCTSTSGGPVFCPVGTLASGDSVSVTVYLQADLVSSLTTTPVQVSVTSSSTDPNGANDSSSTSTTINPSTGGETTVFVPPSDEAQSVATGPQTTLNGNVTPIATPGDTTVAALVVPPGGPGGVVTVAEQSCQVPFVCTGSGTGGGIRQPGTIVDGVVLQFDPPDSDFYDFENPLQYVFTYDRTVVPFVPKGQIKVYYIKDGAPGTVVRAKHCGSPLTASTVFPCLQGKRYLPNQDPDLNGDLRIRLLATYNDPKISTRVPTA